MFFKNLIFNLMQGGYKVFNPNYNFDLETIPSLHLYKIENGSFVFLRVVKGAETGQDEFASQTESIMEYLDESVKPDFKNIFFVTLIISGNSIGALDKYSITTEEFNSQEIYPIYWVIDTETKKLISEKNQPSRLFDLDKLITGSFEYKSILGAAAPNTSAFQSLVNEYSPNQEKKLEPSVTYVLIALNVLYFALMELNGGTVLNSNLLKFGAFSTPLVTSGEYFRVLASCFIHIGYTHLIYNMMALYIFGNICEKQLGHALYLLVYLVAGLAGNLATALFLQPDIISAGASGCLYGVIGCIGGLAFISRSSIHGLSFYSFAVYIALTVFSGLIDPRMNNAAHIGGALAGFICGVIIAYIKKKNIERATA